MIPGGRNRQKEASYNQLTWLCERHWGKICFLMDGIVRLKQSIQIIILAFFKVPWKKKEIIPGGWNNHQEAANNNSILAMLKTTLKIKRIFFLVNGIGRNMQTINNRILALLKAPLPSPHRSGIYSCPGNSWKVLGISLLETISQVITL